MDIERIPDPIQWSEGMPLAPQHFQQSDRYWHALLQHQMLQLQPHYWGLLDMKLDESALRTGKIDIKSLHAVMPDGLVVQYPASDDDARLQKDISAEPSLRDNKPLTIQLAVPVHTEGAASTSSSIQRFDSLPGSLECDENTGTGRVAVGRVRARLSLQIGEQIPAKYVALPLLQVRRDFGGHFDLTDFHPPMLQIGAARFLGETSLPAQLAALAARIRRKAKELLGATDEAGLTQAVNFANTYQRQVVRQLVAALPSFELLARMPTTHPLQLYVSLAQMVGHMAGIDADPLPLLLEPYRHADAAPGFLQAIRHLSAAVSKLSAAYTAIVFEHPNDGIFTCELPQGLRTDRLIVEIKPGGGQNLQTTAQWLRQAFIGSAPMMPLLRQRRVPGGRVRPLSPSQTTALGATGGGFYEIQNQPIQHEEKLLPAIQRDTVLNIEGPANDAAPSYIVLYVPNRQNVDDRPDDRPNDRLGASTANG